MDTIMKCREDLLCGVNRVEDPDNMSELEREHLVTVTAPEQVSANEPFEVTVEVGENMSHPQQPKHYIDFIDLYAGDTYIARIGLTPTMTSRIMKARVLLSHTHDAQRAFAHCNLHRTWEGRAAIEVFS